MPLLLRHVGPEAMPRGGLEHVSRRLPCPRRQCRWLLVPEWRDSCEERQWCVGARPGSGYCWCSRAPFDTGLAAPPAELGTVTVTRIKAKKGTVKVSYEVKDDQ